MPIFAVWLPAVLFVASIGVLHLLAWTSRWPKRTWMKLDYVWLAATAIFVLSLVADLAGISAGIQLPLESGRASYYRQFVRQQAGSYANLLLEGYDYEKWQHSREDIPDFEALGEWCRDLEVALKDTTADSWMGFVDPDGEQTTGVPEVLDIKEELLDMLQHLFMQTETVRSLEDSVDGGVVRWISLIASVFLFPVALAIPIARVTAGLRGWIAE